MNFFSKWMAPAILIGVNVSSSATAQVSYDWSWNDGTNNGTGTLTVSSALTSTGEQVTAFSGLWDGSAIVGLVPPNGFSENDNLLYSGSQPLDDFGLSFGVGTKDWNIYQNGIFSYSADASGFGVRAGNALSLSPAPVAAPEIDPASMTSGLVLLVGGLLVLRGRRQLPLAA